jgi:hypothetical protein
MFVISNTLEANVRENMMTIFSSWSFATPITILIEKG